MNPTTLCRRLALGLALAWPFAGVAESHATDDYDDKPIVLKSALIIEDEAPLLLPVKQVDPPSPAPVAKSAQPPSTTGVQPQKPPASSTATPTPLPAPVGEGMTMQPVPLDGQIMPFAGEAGPPTVGPLGVGDRFPVYYRDRPVGKAASKAEIIARNRSGEPSWYKEWRCTHYGYYPTQWRPWPNGWHEARNLPPTPYVHPYDLKQPEPDWPDGKKPELPERLKRPDREKKSGGQDKTGDRKGLDPQKRASDPVPAPPPLKGPPGGTRGTN